MNSTELAKKMLQWEELQNTAKRLEKEIAIAVLVLGKTQTVGNARATYSKPRKKYDYEAGYCQNNNAAKKPIEDYRKVSYDWREACKDNDITEIPCKESPARVTLKLL